ncbi:hypothetical protein D0C36_00005 [Mucilaginibacter conchicola]|uniref:Tetratricopeptide repeat protein n=1 Tax=Mucilaginibacter conchicola TaxID=2303333 RepID=A0A372NV45_9SPHI|nr:hypothetical protein [Mucilaginibacter conchicola]RFZ93986.1 hypothetical protein D0C36_00005 [Mucilaginibacter conchicola]
MQKDDLVKLVKTLSVTEKRCFRMNCKKQSCERDYLSLFDIIENMPNDGSHDAYALFKAKHPTSSFHTTATYLYDVITDSLVSARCDKDPLFKQMQSYMRAKVLLDRSFTADGLKELRDCKQLAGASQNHLMEYMALREEINVTSLLNFPDIDDNKLIALQSKGKSILKTQQQVHEHYSLFEILRYRLINAGKITTEQGKQHLNDLLLSELSLVTGKVAHNFESAKLHLLFQSFFFTSTGDYRSALRTFSELNILFEQNLEKPGANLADYLSTLEGILDSLRTLKGYDDMPFFIKKLEALVSPNNQEYLNQRILKTALIYQLVYLTANKDYDDALRTANAHNSLINNALATTDYEQYWELLLYISIAHVGLKQYDKALKHLRKITPFAKNGTHSTVYKAARLLGIILRHELGDTDFIDYEIRAYKRQNKNNRQMLQVEKLVLKAILANPVKNNPPKNKQLLAKLQPAITAAQSNNYDLQIIKYYDFPAHIINKFSYKQRTPIK